MFDQTVMRATRLEVSREAEGVVKCKSVSLPWFSIATCPIAA